MTQQDWTDITQLLCDSESIELLSNDLGACLRLRIRCLNMISGLTKYTMRLVPLCELYVSRYPVALVEAELNRMREEVGA